MNEEADTSSTVRALFTAATLLVTACGQAGATSGPLAVTATEDEWHIALSQTTVPAGKVTFVLTNKGKVQHELVFLKTDAAQDKIPPGDKAGKVSEASSVGEIADVDPGQTTQMTFDLQPGSYVLMCNKTGHYEAGMHVAFVVK